MADKALVDANANAAAAAARGGTWTWTWRAKAAAALGGAVVGAIASEAHASLSVRQNALAFVFGLFNALPTSVREGETKEDLARKIRAARAGEKLAVFLLRNVVGFPKGCVSANTTFVQRTGEVIPVKMVRPAHLRGPLPVLVFLHGGGFVVMSTDMYEGFMIELALATNSVVVSCDYRLAPEHPFPAGLNDCSDFAEWVWSAPSVVTEFGGDPRGKGIALSGDSAGGCYAATVAVELKSRVPFTRQVLFYPCTTLQPPTLRSSSCATTQNYRGPFVTLGGMAVVRELYLRDPHEEWKNPRVSPTLLSPDAVRGACPALIIAASHDPLLDDANSYASVLRSASVPVDLHVLQGAFHGFGLIDLSFGYREGWDLVGTALRGPSFGRL